MPFTIFVVIVYGLFTVAGGVIGYLNAKSRASHIAGSLSGLTLLAAAYSMRHGNPAAPIVVIGVALFLGGRFAMTWTKNRRLAPDLLMVVLSIAALLAGGFTLAGR